MITKIITEQEKNEYNAVVTHPLQAYEWGEFREKTGVTVIRRGFFENDKITSGFQLTIHKIPKTNFTIGYLPKGNLPTRELFEEVERIGKENNCIFIQFEPNITAPEGKSSMQKLLQKYHSLKPSAHPLFTRYTFQMDLTQTEEEILKKMHPKARYNIKVAKKHGVEIKSESTNEALAIFLQLNKETNLRQGFYSRPDKEFKLLWNILKAGTEEKSPLQDLQAHLLIAYYTAGQEENQQATGERKALTAWILFSFHDSLYYPYGASSILHREVMASNLMMWEAIRFGKNLGLKTFDMWGSLGENANSKDPWYGFHNFKQRYGPELVEFVGSYDLIINPPMYNVYKLADKIRWSYLKLMRRAS